MARPAWPSLEPRELRVGLWSFGILLLSGIAEVTIKNVGDTLFIKRVGVEMLPAVFLPNALFLVLTTGAVGWLASRVPPLALLTFSLVGSALVLVPLFVLVRLDVGPSYWLLVMASKQVESVALIGFLVAIGHLLHARQSKRLLAPILAGSTAGQILGSFATESLGRAFGIDGVLPVAAGALGLAAVVSLRLRPLRPPRLVAPARGRPPPPPPAPPPPPPRDPIPTQPPAGGTRTQTPGTGGGGAPAPPPPPPPREEAPSLRVLWREGWLFRALAWCSFAAGLLGPIVYFQFNYVADRANADEQGLLAFFSAFRGWLSFGVLGAQVVAAPWVFRRFGVPLASLASPSIYLGGLAGLSLRLSLPAGVAVMAGSTVSDHALFDPGQKVLANLFPESRRARVNALVEGPIKRAGTVGGSLLAMAVLALGGAPAVGLVGLPIAALWLGAGLRLWRSYPSLLLAVAGSGGGRGTGGVELDEVLDDRTLRVLAGTVREGDPATAAAAVALLREAPAPRAAQALAEILPEAPEGVLGEVTSTLAELVDAGLGEGAVLRPLAEGLEQALRHRPDAPPELRAHWIRLLGLAIGEGGVVGAPPEPVLAALRDPDPGVRLAALMALERLGRLDEPEDLRRQLAAAASSEEPGLRRVAARELRSWLLAGDGTGEEASPEWDRRLELLGELCARGGREPEAWQALVAVARRFGPRTARVAAGVLKRARRLPPDLTPCALRVIGHAGLRGHADDLVEALGSSDPRWAEAAFEGLLALGPAVVDRLLVELNFGGRTTRDAIVLLLRELDVAAGTLRDLLESEYRAIEDALVKRAALHPGGADPAVVQRLDERMDESTHSALLLLSALLEDDRIVELSGLLRRAETDRERAVLLEALEALLPPAERARLLPLIEDRGARRRSGAGSRAAPLPDPRAVLEDLLRDSDPLIRGLVAATSELGDAPVGPGSAATPATGPDAAGAPAAARGGGDTAMLSEVEIVLHLRSLPIFSRLTLRQLSDLARVVRQETHPAGAILVREGEFEDCMYLIVSGRVRITREGAFVRELGPREFFGEMAMFTGATRSATIEAVEPVHLLRIERQDLLRLMEELPGIAVAICQTLSERLADMTARVGQ